MKATYSGGNIVIVKKAASAWRGDHRRGGVTPGHRRQRKMRAAAK